MAKVVSYVHHVHIHVPTSTLGLTIISNFFFRLLGWYIRESVDSLCRDDADMPMPPYIRKACNRPNAAFVSLFR